MEVKQIDRISEIDAESWNRLTDPDYPFIRHEFLSALENSASVSKTNGWLPRHLLILERNQLLAAMPLYLKHHSFGEYVFDQQWAEAYRRHGLPYYPKWLTAIPFTPCQGPRIITDTPARLAEYQHVLTRTIMAMSEDQSISSWHCLFPNEQQTEILKSAGFSIREGVQFQWFNRDYYDFSDFLQTLTSEKRKMIKRERRKVLEAGIELIAIAGCDITLHHWQLFFQCYQMTYFKNGMQPYLNLDFFVECQHSMPDNLLLTLVRKNGEYIAAALYIIGTNTLYGRYWGCLQEHSFLHFEACYYHGIDQCIARKLKRFDSGAQGEHKITRGFTPIKTYSAHWLRNAIFADAVESFLAKERKAMHNYHLQANSYLPFKKTQR